jgi:hypothetical protein
MVRIGRMATSLVVPLRLPGLVTALAPIGLDLANGWSLQGHGCHLLVLGAGRFIPRWTTADLALPLPSLGPPSSHPAFPRSPSSVTSKAKDGRRGPEWARKPKS